jgi:hypothetical protein
LLAVVYRFETYEGGERRLVTEEGVPASTLYYLLPQLEAVPKRTLVDSGPGLLVYSTYQDARYAASVVTTLATHVALREVAPVGDAPEGAVGANGEALTAASGARYAPVPGGMSEIVKQ